MHHAADILLTLFVIFIAAQIGAEIAQRLKLPGVVGEIAAGCVVGPSALGWLTPEDCAPELANELFHQRDSGWGMGVHPRLVHSRHGLHIVEVLGRRNGTLPPFEALAPRIADELSLHTRATAWRQFMQLLVGEAEVRGMALDGASSPLVQ